MAAADMTLSPISRLLAVMARLRHPTEGCPWDVQQDFASIAPYTIEEAYEVADAIERGDLDDLKEELGDLLLQVVFHSRMAEEAGAFRFDDVATTIADKMERRHPYVFGDVEIGDAARQSRAWEDHKAAERAGRASAPAGMLDDIPHSLPALMRAQKLGKRAGRVGFDWPAVLAVLEKVREETGEVEAELAAADRDPAALEHEIGDLLFAVVQLARHAGIDAETALMRANRRFSGRFGFMERRLAAAGLAPEDVDPAELERLWAEAKADERGGE